MRPLVVHCHLGLGRLFGQTRREEAVQHLDTAAELFCEMDMTFWLTRADEALGSSGDQLSAISTLLTNLLESPPNQHIAGRVTALRMNEICC